eukprot:5401301-Heterocapsa_arctica.AAC.1
MSCITIRFLVRQSVNARRRVARLGPRLEACGRQAIAWLDAGVYHPRPGQHFIAARNLSSSSAA